MPMKVINFGGNVDLGFEIGDDQFTYNDRHSLSNPAVIGRNPSAILVDPQTADIAFRFGETRHPYGAEHKRNVASEFHEILTQRHIPSQFDPEAAVPEVVVDGSHAVQLIESIDFRKRAVRDTMKRELKEAFDAKIAREEEVMRPLIIVGDATTSSTKTLPYKG